MPLSATLVVVGDALCEKMRDPLAAPTAMGLNATVTVQLLPAATVPPEVQVLGVTAYGPLAAKATGPNAVVPVLDSVTV